MKQARKIDYEVALQELIDVYYRYKLKIQDCDDEDLDGMESIFDEFVDEVHKMKKIGKYNLKY